MTLFLLSFGALFSIINPMGTLPMFIGLTSEKSKIQINKTAFLTVVNTFIILLISFFLGSAIIRFFGISIDSLKIAGGIIIASSGFALLNGTFTKHKGMKRKEKEDAYTRSDIALTPLAMPMLAGPGSISLLITYNQEYELLRQKIILISAVLLICTLTFALLISSRVIIKALGASGINALSRVIGFINIALGVEYILSALLNIASRF